MNNSFLKIDKILDFYDEPQLFIARDKFDAQYICLLYDDTPKYTAVKISNERLKQFLSGKLDLRDLFATPENKGEYFDVSIAGNNLEAQPLPLARIPEERLPARGYTLDASTHESITVNLPVKDHGLFTELVRKFGWACM